MKKLLKLLLTVSMVFIVSGCSNEIDTITANPTGVDENLVSGAGEDVSVGTLDLIYQDLRDADGGVVATQKMLDIIAELELDLANNPTLSAIYDARIQSKLLELASSDSYLDDNGVFSERLLVRDLQASLYNISCDSCYGPTYDENNLKIEQTLLCDYTDYINKVLKSEVLTDLLKEQYIYDVKMADNSELIASRDVREVEYFAIPYTSGSTDALDFMTTAIAELVAGKTFDELAQEWYDKQITDLEEEYAKISTEDDENYSIYYQFAYNSNTGVYYNSLEDGLLALKQKIYQNQYVNSFVFNSNDDRSNMEISETLLDLIASETVLSDNVFQIGSDYYLVSPLATGTIDENDVIVYDSTNAQYMFIKVSVIDETSSEEDIRTAVADIKQVSSLVKNYVTYYLDKYEISVHDEDLYNYLQTQYPTIFTD